MNALPSHLVGVERHLQRQTNSYLLFSLSDPCLPRGKQENEAEDHGISRSLISCLDVTKTKEKTSKVKRSQETESARGGLREKTNARNISERCYDCYGEAYLVHPLRSFPIYNRHGQ